MGSSLRPHRQARSAKVSYKDSYSEEEDFFITEPTNTKTSDSKNSTRRILALKRISRSQERENAKERAEAVQLQRAIKESLSKGAVNANRVSSADESDHAREVVDSEDEVPSVCATDADAFQCLNAGPAQEVLERISTDEELSWKQMDINEMPMPPNGNLHGEKENGENSGDSNEKLKARIQEDVDWSCEEEDDDDQDVTEDESSDVSEDLGFKRKRPGNPQHRNKKAVAGHKANNDKSLTAQVKKSRSARPVSKARVFLSAKKCSSPKSLGVEPVIHVKLADAKENVPTSYTSTTNKHASNSKELKEIRKRGGSIKSCQTAPVIEPQRLKKAALFDKASLFDNASCESSGILGLQAQSPTLLHRRVIGLSRRFRPPPLHPYLPKMKG